MVIIVVIYTYKRLCVFSYTEDKHRHGYIVYCDFTVSSQLIITQHIYFYLYKRNIIQQLQEKMMKLLTANYCLLTFLRVVVSCQKYGEERFRLTMMKHR